MSISAESVKEKLEKSDSFTPLLHINVDDISGGCGTSFSITLVSSVFEEKRILDRHRMIHAVLADDMQTIHALKLKCLTPDKFTPTPAESS